MTAADRMRRTRARYRQGIGLLRIEVNLFELSELLVEQGFLAFGDCEDKVKIAAALEQYIAAVTRYE